MSGLTVEQRLLLELSAAALFDKQVSIPDGVDWRKVMKESYSQSVALLVFKVCEGYLSDDLKKRWNQLCCCIIHNNVYVERDHADLHRLMTKNQIPYVAMKGCVSASYYPDPSVRLMGDVDFLVRPEVIESAGLALTDEGFVVNKEKEEDIHISYQRTSGAVRPVWEMHWEPNGIPGGSTGEKIRKYLDSAIRDAVVYETQAGMYMGPSVFHHGLFMLIHMATHLINAGIGLRHLCDWAVFAGSLSEEAFCEIFEQKLKDAGLWRFAQLLTQLSTVYLGCPEKAWAGDMDTQLLEAMIADLLSGGNFGYKDGQRINQAKLMTDKTRATVDETPLFIQLVHTMNEKARTEVPAANRYPVLLPFVWGYVGIRHLLRIAAGKRPRIRINQMISGANERKNVYKQFALFQTEEGK